MFVLYKNVFLFFYVQEKIHKKYDIIDRLITLEMK
jgi:hypothetical protein